MKKEAILTAIGAVGSLITTAMGGWSTGLVTLLIFMACDWLTGLIVAGVFNASTKSANGALDSAIGLRGICKKGMMLLLILIAHRFDLTIGTTYIRDAVIIALIVNESVSLIENAKLMGIPIPNVLNKAIDVLKNESEGE